MTSTSVLERSLAVVLTSAKGGLNVLYYNFPSTPGLEFINKE
ncbi:hypothetical protein CLAFUW4_06361 [Fulvia fulva]|nr:uncharacterized protein CLAFUR5_20214 [Fulvia fulva]KAK4623616.1 hypothetical protein CLAFUR4_06364 [Fulvia fulva]KAK4625845.1 hypothetical protein CLAFUR0_06366 [Fulvia fulva]WMI38912.1 hypothetical protein CLAFUR5_20214 [Fulvia fulva]WPV14503.1 hypothetical protein CLAFUW4_06361 [Fulvia fulva]WPV29658.1 hypothetical protein CLAFUW7_06359 [Fulvia fulva]